MREISEIDEIETARIALHPTRVELLQRLRTPQTCAALAQALHQSPQRVNHHLKELLAAGLIRVARRRRVKNFLESTYEAVAKAYWLSPRLVRPSSARDRDDASLHHLLTTAEAIHADVAALLQRTDEKEVPSLGFDVDLRLGSEGERQAFARDVLEAIRPVIERYQGTTSPDHAYKLRLVCYPNPETE